MNKKRTFLCLLLVVFSVALLSGCNVSSKTKPTTSGKPTVAANDWKDINEENCLSILKDKTGIDISKIGSFTVTNAYGAYTKVCDITGKYGASDTKVSMFEKFIKELLRVSENSIWTTDVNNETYRIFKVDEYTDYETYYSYKLRGNEDLSLDLGGSLYIETYTISYAFTNSQFNIHVANYVIK